MIGGFIARFLYRGLEKIAPPALKIEMEKSLRFYRRTRDRRLALKAASADGCPRRSIIDIRHVSFDELQCDGFDIVRIDDGVDSIDLSASVPSEMSNKWKNPIPVIAPAIARLHGSTLLEDGSVLIPGGRYCLAEPTFTTPGWYKRRNRPTLRWMDPVSCKGLLYMPERRIAIQGRCFSARHSHPGNFGHFVHDVLTRIYYEELGALEPGRDKIIAPCFHFQMQKALFDRVYQDYEIVHIPNDIAIEPEELLLPANLCTSTGFNPASIAALARRLRRSLQPYARMEKCKVCVSRRDGKNNWWNYVNEGVYEKHMETMGYRIVEVTRLDPNAQFDLWANTTDIVGIHGAGMMNMLMMPTTANCFEIANKNGPNWIARCTVAAGHRLSVIPSLNDSKGQFKIDIDRLIEQLGMCLFYYVFLSYSVTSF